MDDPRHLLQHKLLSVREDVLSKVGVLDPPYVRRDAQRAAQDALVDHLLDYHTDIDGITEMNYEELVRSHQESHEAAEGYEDPGDDEDD